jgi:outer membrane receptor protein involved in Fe transport
MKQVMDVIIKTGTLEAYRQNAVSNTTTNYEGNEYGSAGYFLADVNIGPMVKIMPGVRYEEIRSEYTAPRGNSSYTGSEYNYRHHDTTLEVTHVNWLPMVHVRFKPLEWFDVRFAYTNTLSYPDFQSITPRIDIGLTNVAWNNVNL